jgi:hypothetical protein
MAGNNPLEATGGAASTRANLACAWGWNKRGTSDLAPMRILRRPDLSRAAVAAEQTGGIRMRVKKTSLSIAAIALGSILVAAPAFAQSSIGRPLNDGGAAASPVNPTGAPSGESEQPSGPVGMMGAPGEQGGAGNCAARFHSFDPATGTYLGFDGRRHTCQ